MTIISCGDKALPRDIDVNIQVTKPQIEETTDLTIMGAITKEADVNFPHGAARIRYYSTIDAVEDDDDIPSDSEAAQMARAFFSQSPRALTMAIAKAFTDPVAGFMQGNLITATVAAFAAITDGSFTISIDGDEQDITGLNFTGVTTFDDIAVIIEAGLQAIGTGGYTASTVEIIDGAFIQITSGTTGATSTVSFLKAVDPPVGTDISGTNFLNATVASGGQIVDGYVPGDLTSEAELIQEAARCSGRPLYGWTFEKAYRDTPELEDFSTDFMEPQTFGIAGIQSNNPLATDPGVVSDIGYKLREAGVRRTFAVWDNVTDQYAEVAILAYMLHVNYLAADSTVTAKFKNLNGIQTVGITETELGVLNNKRYNTFTAVGNNARTYRDGVNANPIWYMDSLINLDNFKEQLQVAIYNVFLREKKIPYTPAGQTKLYNAAYKICTLFVVNGTFADRLEQDPTRPNGNKTIPAFQIELQPLELVTEAQRQAREGTPMTINAYEAGAMHSLRIDVTAFT